MIFNEKGFSDSSLFGKPVFLIEGNGSAVIAHDMHGNLDVTLSFSLKLAELSRELYPVPDLGRVQR